MVVVADIRKYKKAMYWSMCVTTVCVTHNVLSNAQERKLILFVSGGKLTEISFYMYHSLYNGLIHKRSLKYGVSNSALSL